MYDGGSDDIMGPLLNLEERINCPLLVPVVLLFENVDIDGAIDEVVCLSLATARDGGRPKIMLRLIRSIVHWSSTLSDLV